MKLRILTLGAGSLVALTACVDDGYGGGVAVGYGGGYYGEIYDGAYGSPYYGWYGGYYYPGTGYYVYDRYRRPMRWSDSQRRYWENRGRYWRSHRHDEWRGFDRGPSRDGGDGYRWRGRSVAIWLLIVAIIMHVIAWGMVRRYAGISLGAGVESLAAISGSIGLAFFLMLSQALEQVTRLFYGRGDLDLLKSSPISLRRVLGLRVLSVATSTCAMTIFVAGPFINVLTFEGGPRWLCGYGVAVAAE